MHGMVNGHGLFVCLQLFLGSQLWDLCLVSASSFRCLWTTFKNREKKQVFKLNQIDPWYISGVVNAIVLKPVCAIKIYKESKIISVITLKILRLKVRLFHVEQTKPPIQTAWSPAAIRAKGGQSPLSGGEETVCWGYLFPLFIPYKFSYEISPRWY